MAAVPEVNILVLGDPDCGKSTLIANLPRASHDSSSPAPYSPAEAVRDADLPLTFNVNLFARPYIFHVSATSSPNELSIPAFPSPDLVILCFAISSRPSLQSLLETWYRALQVPFGHLDDRLPIMLLGLKRDLRATRPETEVVLPQEGHHMAQKLHCDSYAECSAMSGELMWEVMEDISRMAAKTTTTKGAKAGGISCAIM